MNKERQRIKAEGGIRFLFEEAKKASGKNPELAKKHVKKAKRLAMHFNIKLPKETRKKFCRNCNTFFNSRNRKIRLKRGFLVFHCLNCGGISRYKAKN